MYAKIRTSWPGFTLVETLVVLLLSAMILTAVLGIYRQVRLSAAAVSDRLRQNRLCVEILQKLAEDIDRLAAPGFEASMTLRNKLDNGLRSAQLILNNSYYGNNNRPSPYESIVWQTTYDAQADRLILYRMHSGLNVEDPVTQPSAKDAGEGLFVPVVTGVTHFEMKAQQGENVLGAWMGAELPKAVRIGLSFEPPQELPDGTVGVPEERVTYRTIAVDRTRLINYEFVKKQFDLPDDEDPNDVTDDAADPNSPAGGPDIE